MAGTAWQPSSFLLTPCLPLQGLWQKFCWFSCYLPVPAPFTSTILPWPVSIPASSVGFSQWLTFPAALGGDISVQVITNTISWLSGSWMDEGFWFWKQQWFSPANRSCFTIIPCLFPLKEDVVRVLRFWCYLLNHAYCSFLIICIHIEAYRLNIHG